MCRIMCCPSRIKELIHGNLQQGDKLIKGIEAWMLTAILYVHDRTRSTIYKLCEILLRPALSLSFPFDLAAQSVEVKPPFILVHSHITPILFYISGDTI